MTADLRCLLVDLQDAWDDSTPTADARLKDLFERLRSELLGDAATRDSLARAKAGGPSLSIPSEPLFLTPQFAALTRSQWRLYGAIHIAAHHFGGLTALMASAQHVEIAAKAVNLSDRIIKLNDEFDRPPPAQPSAAAVSVNGGPHSADCVKSSDPRGNACTYLLWLAKHQPVYFSVRPPELTDAEKARCEREMLKQGLVCTDEHNRYLLTDDGEAVVERLRAKESVRLSEIDDAA